QVLALVRRRPGAITHRDRVDGEAWQPLRRAAAHRRAVVLVERVHAGAAPPEVDVLPVGGKPDVRGRGAGEVRPAHDGLNGETLALCTKCGRSRDELGEPDE